MPGSARPSVVARVGARYQLIRELRGDGDTVEWEGFDAALGRPVTVRCCGLNWRTNLLP